MAFSTLADVKALVDTDMADAEITDLINRTDQRIIARIDTGSVNAFILEDLSATWTAYRVMLKDPNSRSIGEYTENRSRSLEFLRAEIDELLEIADSGIMVVPTRSELQ